MALGPRLDLRQSQSLVMTPQLQQAIKLLQMSNVELSEFIEQEVEQNPLIEREDADGGLESESGTPEAASSQAADEPGGGDRDTATDEPEEVADSADHASSDSLVGDDSSLDTGYENVYEPESASDGAPGGDDSLSWSNSRASSFDDDLSGMENVAAEDLSLRDHLIGQINLDFKDPSERMIAGRLVDMLDDNGWLAGDVDAVAQALGCDVEEVTATLQKCQRLDPPGVFGRSLAECLALQLREKDRLDPAMQALVDNLELLAKREFAKLRRLCGVDDEDLLEMVREIKELNPRPASAFDHEVAQPVVPDVFVRRNAQGWHVELNADTMPRVLVNSRYYARVRKHARSKQDKEFLSDRLQSANWLVRALHQRAETIVKVAAELVVQQEGFFEHGVAHLKPLTLRDVAEVVGVHESTVSRVTANKYLGSSRGIFELKYFFTTAVGEGDSGESRSAEAVRHQIKQLIDRETPEAVLSDDKIVDLLRDEGIEIARRTVAKYREAMRIPSSVRRRREKALHL